MSKSKAASEGKKEAFGHGNDIVADEAAGADKVSDKVVRESGIEPYLSWPQIPGWDTASNVWSAYNCRGTTDVDECYNKKCDMCKLNNLRYLLKWKDNILPSSISSLITAEEASTGNLCGVASTACESVETFYTGLPSWVVSIIGALDLDVEFIPYKGAGTSTFTAPFVTLILLFFMLFK